MKSIKVSAWNNNKHDPRGNGYGIRVGINDIHLFEKFWSSIELSIESGDLFEVSITPSFWNGCSEIRNLKIGQWLIANNHQFWKKYNPPKFVLTKIVNNKFKLTKD